MMKTLRTATLAVATIASAAALSLGWSGNAEARARLYVSPRSAVHAVYHPSKDLPWYAVRAYYWHGPWSGPGYSYSGWAEYAKINGISCTPGTIVKPGDGIWYACQ